MKYAIIENEKVANIAKAESPLADNWVQADDSVKIGQLYSDGVFSGPLLTLEDLENLREQRKNVIRKESEEAYEQPVTLPDGSVWNGGMDSALAIDGVVRLAENAGLTQISLYDSTNTERVVDIATGKSIAAAIGTEYQRLFGIKQACMVQLDGIDLTSATAKDEIEAVVFAS
jgi:hypothetical protein